MKKLSISEPARVPIPDTYEAYGCRINSRGVDELFLSYERAGFLYAEKARRLAPYMALVKDNWKRAMRAGELILYVTSYEDSDTGAWASVTSWRSTERGWNTQHLVGAGGPSASRAVMLSTQAECIRNPLHDSHQNWFQRSNRFANKVFGSIGVALGKDVGWVGDYGYFALPLDLGPTIGGSFLVRPYREGDRQEIQRLSKAARSQVFLRAEGLDDEDILLEAVDELYRKVGLRRYRRVWVSLSPQCDQILGFALSYRGPLGLNFSFVENRCDLILDPLLSDSDASSTIEALLSAAVTDYADFPARMIPITINCHHADHLTAMGAEHVRDYAQSVWIRNGFEPWYRHVEQIYNRVVRAERRVGLARHGTDGEAVDVANH